MTTARPSQMDIVQEFVSLQSRAMRLLLDSDAKKNAGELTAAVDAYRQLIAVLQRQFELAELNSRYHADTAFPLSPPIEPLMNAELTLADVLEALGEFEPAEGMRQNAVALAERYMPGTGTAERHRQRAQSLLAQSRYPEALVSLYGALDEFKRHGELLQVASVSRNIAEVLEWLGDYSRALEETQRAAKLLDDVLEGREPADCDILEALRRGQWSDAGQHAKLLSVWLDLEQITSRINRNLGNLDQAELQFRKMLSKIPGNARPGLEFQLILIDIRRGKHQSALRELDRIAELFAGLYRPKLGVVLSWKAEALLALQHPRQALDVARESEHELIRYHDGDSLWRAQWRLGRVHAALGDKEDALEAFVRATQTVDNLRKSPLGYRLDSTYMAEKLPLFEQAIGLACELRQARIGCTLMELVKSRALTAALSLPRSGTSDQGNELQQQVDMLSRQIDALEYTIHRQGGTDVIERRRNQLLQHRAMLLEQVRFSDPRWRSLTAAPTFAVEQVLKLLDKGRQTALTLFCRPGEIVAVLLKDGDCRIAAQRLSAATEAALLVYSDNLSSKRTRPEYFDPMHLPDLSADNLVPAELLDDALSASSLLVVPHGRLHLLPWAGLSYKGKRLFSHCPVGVLPNLSCVVTLQTEPNGAPKAALIGAPKYQRGSDIADLPWAEAELQLIADIYSSMNGLIDAPMVGPLATEKGFRQLAATQAATGAVLHIACHGKFETGDPMNSGLLLADGRLDAADIAHLQLPFNEVVLSACSTGYRPTNVHDIPLSGDDVLGLPAALLEAGARALLVSVPPARDDATLELMTLYHEQRAAGASPLQSLQHAQERMEKDGRYPGHLWIGFTLYGCQ